AAEACLNAPMQGQVLAKDPALAHGALDPEGALVAVPVSAPGDVARRQAAGAAVHREVLAIHTTRRPKVAQAAGCEQAAGERAQKASAGGLIKLRAHNSVARIPAQRPAVERDQGDIEAAVWQYREGQARPAPHVQRVYALGQATGQDTGLNTPDLVK